MVELRQAGGKLSVDKLARQRDQSFDETKRHLVRLERQGMAWHPYKSRTYHQVEAANVPHELAYRALEQAGVDLDAEAVLSRQQLQKIARIDDRRSVESLVSRWQQAGILRPSGKGRWKLGASFLEYVSQRSE